MVLVISAQPLEKVKVVSVSHRSFASGRCVRLAYSRVIPCIREGLNRTRVRSPRWKTGNQTGLSQKVLGTSGTPDEVALHLSEHWHAI
jgi:hypothetical protein